MGGNIFATGMGAFDDAYDRVNKFRTDRAQIQAGKALSAGNYGGAADALGQAGMIGPQVKLMDAQHEQQLQEAQRKADALVKVAQGLKNIPVGQRKATLDQLTPVWQQVGVDPSMFSHLGEADLTDDRLDAFTASLGKAVEEYTLAPGAARYRGAQKLAEQPLSPKYQVLHEGDTLVSTDPNDKPGSPVAGGPTPGASSSSAPAAPSGSFDSIYGSFVAPHEGGYTASDGNGAPANFGINQKANPDVNVAALNPDQAKEIYRQRYWAPSGADKLPPALAAVQFDTAVNMGVGAAKQLLQQSGGDPNAYLQLRAQRYQQIAQADPSKAASLPVWLKRNQDLAQYVGTLAATPASPQGGAAPASSLGGARVIASVPKAPKQQTPPSGYRWNGDKLEPIPGGPADPGGLGGGAATSNLHGDDFLKTLPPNQAQQVKAIAEGRMQFPSGFALKTPYWQQMLSAVGQYDPTFDAVNYNARAKTRADFTSGKNAQNIKALNTAIGHLATLDNQISGTARLGGFLGATDANAAINWFSRHSGDPGVTNFEQTASALSTELTAVFRGTGGAEADVKRYLDQLNSNASEAQKKAAVRNIAELLNSRLEAIGAQYEQGMGTTKDPLDLLNPKAAAAFKQLSGRAGGAAPPASPPKVIRYDANGNRIQ